nr:putative Translation machinery-associated protein 20 [Seculamonas ecuadoriensis]
MLKKFSLESSGGSSLAKSSISKAIRKKVVEQYPELSAEFLEEVFPKKAQVTVVKGVNHINIIVVEQRAIFIQTREGTVLPTLRVLHKYPFMMPHMQVDRGAVKFVLSGSHIMCPGLTSPGGRMVDVPAETPVAIMVEGKEHAIGVGVTKMSTADIRSVNKGIAIELLHELDDGLWHTTRFD